MKNKICRIGWLVLFVMAMAVGPTFAQAGSTQAQEADRLFQAQKWAEAAAAYAAITKAEASNGRAWFRLGVALHSLGQYAQAIGAYQKALEINKTPSVMYNLASSYARMNDLEQAFEWLKKSINAGFAQVGLLKADADLASLRTDARFKEILELADKAMRPCMYSPEYRQFDFWLGEWDVQISGQTVGTNSVQSILDGCVLLENWTGGRGGTGKSFNFYDASTGKWQQTWVSSTGSVLNYTGEYKDNALRYAGETRTKSGDVTLHRMTFFNLGAERVRQFAEQSTDNGKTWIVTWDAIYVHKK